MIYFVTSIYNTTQTANRQTGAGRAVRMGPSLSAAVGLAQIVLCRLERTVCKVCMSQANTFTCPIGAYKLCALSDTFYADICRDQSSQRAEGPIRTARPAPVWRFAAVLFFHSTFPRKLRSLSFLGFPKNSSGPFCSIRIPSSKNTTRSATSLANPIS